MENNMQQNPIDPNRPVAEILDEYPQLASVFIQNRLYCVGCSMSMFDNLHDISQVYGLNLENFLAELYSAL